MDKQISEKLDALLKYIPFIDFIVDIDKEKYLKFVEIKKWIISKKRCPLSDLNKMEKSIITQYKNIIGLVDKKIPEQIMQIFVDEFKHQYVDLCSDEEDNTKKINSSKKISKCTTQEHIESDDDLEIVSVSYLEKSKSKCNSALEVKEENSSTLIKKNCAVIDALDETSVELLRHIDLISNKESMYADPHNYHENSDDDNIFQRRGSNLYQRREENEMKTRNKCNEKEQKRRCISVSSNTVIDTISLESSDDETSNSAVGNNNAKCLLVKKNAVIAESNGVNKSCIETESKLQLTSRSEDKCQNPGSVSVEVIVSSNTCIDLNKDILKEGTNAEKKFKNTTCDEVCTNEQKNGSSHISMDTCLDNSSKEKVLKCVKENDVECNDNVEKLLLHIIKALSKPASQEPTPELGSPIDQIPSNGNHNLKPDNDVSPAPRVPHQFERITSQNYQQPIFYPNAIMYQHPYDYSTTHSNKAYFDPIQALASQRGLNLKDPRIRNWLNIYKNSPLLSATERDRTANLLGNTITQVGNINQPFIHSAVMRDPIPQTFVQNSRMSHRTQTAVHTTSGMSSKKNHVTYGEYKRRRAEEQQRAEQQREAERKRQEDSLKQKINGNAEKDQNIKEKDDEIRHQCSLKQKMHGIAEKQQNIREKSAEVRSILVNTLQEYTKKFESLGKLYKKPIHVSTNSENETNPPNSVEKKKDIVNIGGEKMVNTTIELPTGNTEMGDDCSKIEIEKAKKQKTTDEIDTSNNTKTIGLKQRSSVHDNPAIQKITKADSPSSTVGYSSQTTNHCTESCTPKRRKTIDDVPKTLSRKRQSSVNARAAIAEQLNSKSGEGLNKQKISPLSRTCTSMRRKTVDELPNERINGSKESDNELNDFEKFRLSKIQKLEETVAHKQPKILLKRLTDDEIINCTRSEENNKANNVLNVLLVESTNQPTIKNVAAKKSSASKKVARKRLNNDCQMTENNTRACVLCSTRPSDLTNHYVAKHKSESYISRLTWTQLDELSINTPFAKVLPNAKSRVRRYSVKCPFCDEELEEAFMSLYHHYAKHTGEYAFQCSGCQLKKPFKADIQSHQLHSKTCRSGHVQTMYRYLCNTMTIYLHYCVICNFVQLNEANILRHLGDHHDLQQVSPNNVKKCILAAISDGTDVSNESQNNSVTNQSISDKDLRQPKQPEANKMETPEEVIQSSQHEMEDAIKLENEFSLDDNIPVCNEACSEELVDSTLYTLEEELKRIHEEPGGNTTRQMTVVHFGTIDTITSVRFDVEIKPELIDCEDQCLVTPPRPSSQTTAVYSQSLPKFTYRSYPNNVNYLGLYKCLVDDCYYSTDSSDEFLSHLEDHGRENMTDEYLQCAYCCIREVKFKTCQQLVDHIGDKHIHMIYQCSMCCYRSCDASNVFVHQQESHNRTNHETCKVYKGFGKQKSYNTQYINEKMATNVRKLHCKYCSHNSFYHSNLLEHHMKTDHKDIHVRKSFINYYSCIFCPLTNNDENFIRKHVAFEHPEELPYVCSHNKFVAENEDFLHNLQTYDLANSVSVIEINATLDSVAEEKSESPADDVKPSVEELLKCNEETVKVRLRKLTEQTGVAPDILYHCPEQSCSGFFSIYDLWLCHMRSRHHCLECKCPHCPTQTTLSLEHYKEHFEVHRRHTYICFHCSQTFSNCEIAVQHASSDHVPLGPMRFEQIRFNINYSYFVMIQCEMLKNRSELLPALLNSLDRSLRELEYRESKKLQHSWLVSSQFSTWLEDYSTDISCMFYICVACYGQYNCRLKLSNHIREEHSARDVVIVSVIRNTKDTYFSLGVVFANERLSFSTMRNCFCCEERDMKADTFVLHLKRYHTFSSSYFCEYCNLTIEPLQVAKKHFEHLHAEKMLKIRCELSSKNELSIISLHNFQVHIGSGTVNERTLPPVVVKQEPTDDPKNDDSVIFLEEDDVTLQDYVRKQENIENNSEKPKLMCIASENLLQPGRDPSSPGPNQVTINYNTPTFRRIKIVQPRHQKSIISNIPTTSLNSGFTQQLPASSTVSSTLQTAVNCGFSSLQVPREPLCVSANISPTNMISNQYSGAISGSSPMPITCVQSMPNYYANARSSIVTPIAVPTRQQPPIIATGNIIVPTESTNNTYLERTKTNCTNPQLKYTSSKITTCFLNSHSRPNAFNVITNSGQNMYVPSPLNRITNHPQHFVMSTSPIYQPISNLPTNAYIHQLNRQ